MIKINIRNAKYLEVKENSIDVENEIAFIKSPFTRQFEAIDLPSGCLCFQAKTLKEVKRITYEKLTSVKNVRETRKYKTRLSEFQRATKTTLEEIEKEF